MVCVVCVCVCVCVCVSVSCKREKEMWESVTMREKRVPSKCTASVGDNFTCILRATFLYGKVLRSPLLHFFRF